MKFYVFSNNFDSSIYALTDNENGDKLPTDVPKEGSRWTFFKSFDGGLEGRIGISLDDEKAAVTDIEKQGYHIHPRERLLKAAN